MTPCALTRIIHDMGRKGLSAAAKRLWKIVDRNVRNRLEAIGVSSCAVSIKSGQRDNWLSDTMRRDGRISLSTLADMAAALGMSPRDLCDPKARCDEMVPTEWRKDR